MRNKFKKFKNNLSSGLKQEFKETKEIPKHIKNGNFKEVKQQIADLGKMAVLVVVWILPAGAIISGFIMKFSKNMRPTAFQKEDKDAPKNKQ